MKRCGQGRINKPSKLKSTEGGDNQLARRVGGARRVTRKKGTGARGRQEVCVMPSANGTCVIHRHIKGWANGKQGQMGIG